VDEGTETMGDDRFLPSLHRQSPFTLSKSSGPVVPNVRPTLTASSQSASPAPVERDIALAEEGNRTGPLAETWPLNLA